MKSKYFTLIKQSLQGLCLPPEREPEASFLLQYATRRGLANGTNPRGLVGGIIYFLGIKHCEFRSQTEVAAAAGVGAPTLKRHYRALLEKIRGVPRFQVLKIKTREEEQE